MSTREDVRSDAETGLALLHALADVLDQATAEGISGNQLAAAKALAQKTGTILERAFCAAEILNGPARNWMEQP